MNFNAIAAIIIGTARYTIGKSSILKYAIIILTTCFIYLSHRKKIMPIALDDGLEKP